MRLCRALIVPLWLTVGALAAEPKPELLFQLPLTPAALTVTPEGGYLLGLSFEGEPQNRVIAINRSGESSPFPTTKISQADPEEALVLDAVEGLQSMDNGMVWMLDNGRRTELAPKVIAWDVKRARLHRVFPLTQPATVAGSLLVEMAVATDQAFVYLADPAAGADAALIVLDTNTGLARRVLQGHPSVVPVAGLELTINGAPVETKRLDGKPSMPKGGVGPLALDRKGEWLYFGPVRSHRLYRIKTASLRDAVCSGDELAGQVEEYSEKPVCDGITLDSKGNIYISDLAAKAIGMIAVGSKEYRTLATDTRFLWPDGLCFDADGRLCFFTDAHKASPQMEARGDVSPEGTNYLFRLQTPASGRVGD
ncbi:MAG: L-dopachrome tautomerase-related protein [Roseimicrobium sp.]